MNNEKNKTNINGYLLIAGLLIIYPVVFHTEFKRNGDLEKIQIELDHKITKLKGKRNSIDYYFFTNSTRIYLQTKKIDVN